MFEHILVDKKLFIELVERLAVYQEASRFMSESRWNNLDWEKMHDETKTVLERALDRVSRIGAISEKIESWFITNYSPDMRTDAASTIKRQAGLEVYADSRGQPFLDRRNEPKYINVDKDEVLHFKRFSGQNSDYADFSWINFKEPRQAIDLLDHVLTKGPEMDEVVKLISFICRHAKANHSQE